MAKCSGIIYINLITRSVLKAAAHSYMVVKNPPLNPSSSAGERLCLIDGKTPRRGIPVANYFPPSHLKCDKSEPTKRSLVYFTGMMMQT